MPTPVREMFSQSMVYSIIMYSVYSIMDKFIKNTTVLNQSNLRSYAAKIIDAAIDVDVVQASKY